MSANRRRPTFLRLLTIVARRDYLRAVRRRGFLFGTLLLPIGLGGLLYWYALYPVHTLIFDRMLRAIAARVGVSASRP